MRYADLVETKHSITTPEFSQWFQGSKVIDGDGKPVVCYHGTFEDFAEFKLASENRKSHGFNRLGFWFDVDPRTPSYFAGVASDRIDSLPASVQGGGNVMPCYLRVTKPLYMDSEGLWGEDADKMREYYALHKRYNASGREDERGLKTEDGSTFVAKSDGLPFDRARYELLGKEVRTIEANYARTDGWHRLMTHLPRGVKSNDQEVDEFKAAIMAEGYDGIYISDTLADHGSRDYDQSNWWVVFNPNQIKSVFASQFNPETDDVREGIVEAFDSQVGFHRVDIGEFADITDPVDGFVLDIGGLEHPIHVVFYDTGAEGEFGCNFGAIRKDYSGYRRMHFDLTGSGNQMRIIAGVLSVIKHFIQENKPASIILSGASTKQKITYQKIAQIMTPPPGYRIRLAMSSVRIEAD